MSLRNVFSIILSLLFVWVAATTLTGCCGVCGEVANEVAERTEGGAGFDDSNDDESDDDSDDSDDEPAADKDDEDEDEKPAAKKDTKDDDEKPPKDAPSADNGDGDFLSISPNNVRKTIEGDGWKVLGEPNKTDASGIRSTLFSIIKPPKGGAVALYDYDDKTIAKSFEKGMRDQGGAVRREGGRVLAVTIPGHPQDAKTLLGKIVGQ